MYLGESEWNEIGGIGTLVPNLYIACTSIVAINKCPPDKNRRVSNTAIALKIFLKFTLNFYDVFTTTKKKLFCIEPIATPSCLQDTH